MNMGVRPPFWNHSKGKTEMSITYKMAAKNHPCMSLVAQRYLPIRCTLSLDHIDFQAFLFRIIGSW